MKYEIENEKEYMVFEDVSMVVSRSMEPGGKNINGATFEFCVVVFTRVPRPPGIPGNPPLQKFQAGIPGNF